MRTTRGVRRLINWAASREAPHRCNWPKASCAHPPLFRNQLASGDIAWTCGEHTPDEPAYRQHMLTLPDCAHGHHLLDWGGNELEPPCGCRVAALAKYRRAVPR